MAGFVRLYEQQKADRVVRMSHAFDDEAPAS